MKMGRVELTAQLLKKHYGWAGHVARMPAGHVAAEWASGATLENWKLQQAVGHMTDKQNKTKWRHTKKGPVTRWDSLLSRVLGPTWQTRAQERDHWKFGSLSFVHAAGKVLLGEGHRMFGLVAL